VRSHTTESVSRVVLFAVSANVSYHAEEDVELFTGIKLPLKPAAVVHRQTFEMPEVKQFVEELSVDGVRLCTPQEPCTWQEYKGCACDEEAIRAYFQDNDALIE